MEIKEPIRLTKELVDKTKLPIDYFDDKILLENSWYRQLFKKSFKAYSNLPWKKGIVKITILLNTGKSIKLRRMFHSGNSLKIKKEQLGLSSINYQIFDNRCCKSEIKLSKGSRFMFMWQHPNHMIRIGFKYAFFLGSISVLISIASIIITFIKR